MGCSCFSKDRSYASRDRTIFHWPNFTFSHSQHTINPRRVHSTFSLTNRPRPGFIDKRRHSIHTDGPTARLPKAYKPSLKSTRTGPTATIDPAMSDQHIVPSGSPPNRLANQHHVQFAGSPPGTSEIDSNNSFRNAHMSASQGQRQSSSDAPPAYHASTGPPPTWDGQKNRIAHEDDLETPNGPPPPHTFKGKDYAPPPGPPPSHAPSEPDPPPHDPWPAIPDNALLTPPPPIHSNKGPTANTASSSAARAHFWCR